MNTNQLDKILKLLLIVHIKIPLMLQQINLIKLQNHKLIEASNKQHIPGKSLFN